MPGWLQRRQLAVRTRNSEPFTPLFLIIPFLIGAGLILPLLLLPFVVERFITGDPAWLPVSRSDILFSDHIFGGYGQDQYAAFILLVLAISTAFGILMGYILVRQPLAMMAHGTPVRSDRMWLRAFGDWFVAILAAIGITFLLALVAGVSAPDAMVPQLLLFVMFEGYILGTSSSKAVGGLWCHRAVRPEAGN